MIVTNLNTLSSLFGLKINGIVSFNIRQELVVLFENNISLTFFGCPMFIDSGIIGDTLNSIKNYSGELGFVTSLKDSDIDWDDYLFCYINVGEELPFTHNKKLRIAYKDCKLEMPDSFKRIRN
jgi:hypothetical protein